MALFIECLLLTPVDWTYRQRRLERQTWEKMSSSESDVASASVDVKGDRNPVRHRLLKTVCLYVSFGTMVRRLEIVTKLTFWQYLPDLLPTTWWRYVVTTYGHIGVGAGRRLDGGGGGRMTCRFMAWAEAPLSPLTTTLWQSRWSADVCKLIIAFRNLLYSVSLTEPIIITCTSEYSKLLLPVGWGMEGKG